MEFEAGHIFVIDKPLEWTSSDVVRKIKFALHRAGYKKIKVGHAGTLDPLATGILLVCVGRATKRVEELQAEQKEYIATMRLGATTPSFDMEHSVDKEYPWEHITREQVEAVLVKLSGERLQTPPIYSAKMIEGRRAYDYAREGENVEMRQALVNIYQMELLECALPDINVRIVCSKGTYIRSLAREIGEELNNGAYLTSLCRIRSGGYMIDEALTVDKVLDKIAITPKIN